jgi:SAM-dependent methyltransferase
MFDCNICGCTENGLEAAHYENPELPSCPGCSSNIRMRWIVHRLSRELFGRSLPLAHFPVDKAIRGMGLTDPAPIATRLAERFTYSNTFFDSDPRFDIRRDPSPLGPLDFLIASEVFEHVEPPVIDAFHNAARLLKPSGVLLFTVPWVWDGDGLQTLPVLHDWRLDREAGRWSIVDRDGAGQVRRFYDPSFDGSAGPSLGYTREHFPELHDWKLSNEDGTVELRNRRRDGMPETFRNLTFHGGPGLALEMRLFTRGDLETKLQSAGFRSIEFDNRESADRGVIFPYPWSHPIVARKRIVCGPVVSGAADVAC